MTITGTGLTDVGFGAANAAAMTVDSDTQITATSPAGTGTADITATSPAGTGTADITATTPAVTSPAGPADQYTYA